MYKAIATVERKTPGSVMGASGSRASLEVPFPVNNANQKNIDLLTEIVSHILNTPDIYDLNNLARPGACGDYAVILKKDVEKKLLPFTVDISGNLTSVVYQNPTRMIKNEATRKKICSDITNSAIRIAAIVVACLSSIQVASDSRDAQAVKPRQQRGGDRRSVVDWLRSNPKNSRNTYLRQGNDSVLNNPNGASDYVYTLSDLDGTGRIVTATLKVTSSSRGHLLKDGILHVCFLEPVTIPGLPESMLPISVLDSTGISWIAGVIIDNAYIPFGGSSFAVGNTPGGLDMFGLMKELFMKETREYGDTRSDAEREASQDLFNNAEATLRNNNVTEYNRYILEVMQQWIRTLGLQPVVDPRNPYAPPAYIPAQGYGYPPAIRGQPHRPYYDDYKDRGQGYDVQYAIPDPTVSRDILKTVESFRELYIKKSCPASVRANTLSISFDKTTHTTRTGVCNDPYWKEAHLGKLLPYMTLQFLCVHDWDKYGKRDTTVREWKDFLNGLAEIYTTGLRGYTLGSPETPRLENISFNVPGLPVCTTTQSPFVKFGKVQEALVAIHTEYEDHVKQIWQIINELVVVFTDPDTRESMVRINPKATKMNSSMYINAVAHKAIKQISTHYLNIERIYFGAAQGLEPVGP